MLIGFTLDTNILTGGNPKSTLLSNNLYLLRNYCTFLKRKKSEKELKLFLSEIAVKEVINHEKDKLKETYDDIVSKYNSMDYAFNGSLPYIDIESVIDNEIKYSKRLNILKVPISEKEFSRIIEFAIEKKPPFVKNNRKKGDAGFKDALIWESILHSKEVDNCNYFYFFTNDNDFFSDHDYLYNEFNTFHKNTIFEIINIKNESKSQQILNNLIEMHDLIKSDIFELYDENIIVEYVNKIKNISITLNKIDGEQIKQIIDLSKITNKEIEVNDVNKNENGYEVQMRINTYIDIDMLRPIYIDLKLILTKTGNNVIYKDYQVIKAEYVTLAINKYLRQVSGLSDTITKISNNRLNEINNLINNMGIMNQIDSIKKQIEPFNQVIDEINRSIEPLRQISNSFQEINYITQQANKISEINNLLNDNDNKK